LLLDRELDEPSDPSPPEHRSRILPGLELDVGKRAPHFRVVVGEFESPPVVEVHDDLKV